MSAGIEKRYVCLLVAGVLLELAYAAVFTAGGGRALTQAVVIAAQCLFYLIAAALTLSLKGEGRRQEVRWIIAFALLFRLTLLPLTPAAGALRLRWDGKIQSAGFNPYQYPPANSLFSPIRTPAEARLEHPDLAAVAPPLAEMVARWDFNLTAGQRREKVLYVGFDFLIMALLLAELRRRQLPRVRVLLYAWAPLDVLEVAGHGHGLTLAIFLTLLALCWLGRRDRVAGLALVGAVFSGYAAWAAVPVWFARARRHAWPWMVPLGALIWLPYIFVQQHVAFPLVHNLAAWLARTRGVNLGLLAKAAQVPLAHLRPGWALLPPTMAAIGASLLWRRQESLLVAAAAIVAALLLGPNLFPWYALWILPGLVLFPTAAWISFSVTVLLGYGVMAAANPARAEILTWAEYGPLYGLLLWQLGRRTVFAGWNPPWGRR